LKEHATNGNATSMTEQALTTLEVDCSETKTRYRILGNRSVGVHVNRYTGGYYGNKGTRLGNALNNSVRGTQVRVRDEMNRIWIQK
jgi:hypothetical protein